jgi:flagellar hook assembly protein FlgD
LPQAAAVSLKIYNLLGQAVASLVDESKPAGFHTMQWNGRNQYGNGVATGVYFYRIEAKPADGSTPFTSLKKMILMK